MKVKTLRLKHLGKLVKKYTNKRWLQYYDRNGNMGSSGSCTRTIWFLDMRDYGRFAKILKIEINDEEIAITLDKESV